MMWLKTSWNRLRDHRRRKVLDEELDEEVRYHLELQTQENIRRGMATEEARFAALRQFGGVEQRKEEWRDLRFLSRLEGWLQDLGYALRAFRNAKGYALFAVASLALGIGANTAIFSLVRSLVIRPLPYPEPSRLVRLFESATWMGSHTWGSVSVPNLKDWRDQNSSFEAIGAYALGGVNLTSGSETTRLPAAHLEAEVFQVMGVKPLLGRAFRPGENEAGKDHVVVLSHGLWERLFGADPGVAGTQIGVDGVETLVVGVMPKGFEFPPRSQVDLWTPIVYRQWALEERGSHWLNVIARLKPGVNWLAAQQEMNGIAQRLEKQHRENATRGVRLEPLHWQAVRGTGQILLVLWFAVAAILLLACANVAHLVLARATGRRRELALRTALGASRWRLTRLFLLESLLLAAAGGVAGFLTARWSLDGLVALAGDQIPKGIPMEWDGAVVLFCIAAAALSAAFAGLIPSFGATKLDVQSGLKEAGSTAGNSLGRSRSALMVCEVALSLVLLIGALALFRSLQVLNVLHLGFETERILTMKISAPETLYQTPASVTDFYRRAVDRVKETPGVSEAAVINLLPVREFFSNANFSIRGRAPSRPGHEPAAEHRVITPGYFRTMGIPLVSGRYFNDEDMADTPRVSIINQRAAEMYWPGKDPVGEWIAIGSEPRPDSWMRIVGVVSNVRHAGPYRPVLTAVYLPACHGRTGDAWPTMNLVVRHHGGASATLAETIRSSIRELDPAVAVYLVKSMSDVVSDAAAGTRLLARMMSLFSALAVVLAVVGVYGVMSYIVTQRTHEIGVRMALGAGRVGMVKLVMARGLRTAGLGVCLGMSATVPLLMVTRHYLVGIDVTYVWTYAIGIVCTVAVAVGATVIPAWHASRVDPVVALRDE